MSDAALWWRAYHDHMLAGYDTVEALQREYIAGSMDVDEFERRMENHLRHGRPSTDRETREQRGVVGWLRD